MKRSSLIAAISVAALFLCAPLVAFAQYYEEEYEWNPREGLHQEEWYDPGDWFDYDTGVDYDYDWWSYPYYGYDYEPYEYDYYDGYYDPYVYDYDGYDTYGYDEDWDWNWGDNENQTNWQTGQRAQIYGTVESMAAARLDRYFNRPQLKLSVETDAGNWRTVVLGPADRFRNLDLEEGDEINVIGQVRNLYGTPTLVASKFSTDNIDRWINVQRQDQNRQDQLRQDQQRRPAKWYHGEIQSTRTVRFRGLNQQHKVAQVRLDDGKVMPVNLGPVGELPSQAVQQGERIAVAARVGKMNNQTALIAERIKLDSGRTIQIDRSAEKLTFQKKSQEQGQASAQRRR